MSLTVTVKDNETGDEETVQVPDGDFLLLCTNPCHLASAQSYPNKGTTVLTVKGRTVVRSV